MFAKLTGTLVNSLAIIIGSIIGLGISAGFVRQYNKTIMHSISLAIIIIGVKGALKSDDLLIIIFSLALGSIIGEFLAIEARLEQFGRWVETRFSTTKEGISAGFVNASLLFCVGSMTIVGSLESGLLENHQTLFAKATLDGISSILFTSTFGIGVILSSITVLLYQGFLTLAASFMKPFLIPVVVQQMSAVGGLLIMAIGFNMLEMQKIKVGNMLPAMFLPLCYFILKQLLAAFPFF